MLNRIGRVFAIAAMVVAVLALSVPGASAEPSKGGAGAVYAITNSTDGNEVIVYHRNGRGELTPGGSFATGGEGTGAGLGSQGAVIVTEDHRLLFAVNAGSGSVSSFRIRQDGSLRLADIIDSGGPMPTSVAFNDGRLYVLNAGTPNNVTGFEVKGNGAMTPLVGSTRPLSDTSTAPAQVSFDAHGSTLIVTERATNRISTFAVDRKGRLSGPTVTPSAGPTPFGFAVTKRNTVLVSEAGAGGGASTYRVGDDSSLIPASSMIMTGQRAACWAVATRNGRFGYVTNAGTGNISGFRIARDGTATLLDSDGVTATTGGNPTDAALSGNSRYLYVRVAALNEIAVFSVRSDGSLVALPSLTGTRAGLAGLAAY